MYIMYVRVHVYESTKVPTKVFIHILFPSTTIVHVRVRVHVLKKSLRLRRVNKNTFSVQRCSPTVQV